MKILFTAFKGVHNTSFQLVDQTAANHILLTNSFQGLEKDISFISSDYSIVYMFGVDKKLIDKVRIETCAKYNDETVCTDFNVHYLVAVVMGMSNVEKSNIHMYKLSLLIAGTAEMEDFLLVSNMNILIFKNLRNLK